MSIFTDFSEDYAGRAENFLMVVCRDLKLDAALHWVEEKFGGPEGRGTFTLHAKPVEEPVVQEAVVEEPVTEATVVETPAEAPAPVVES